MSHYSVLIIENHAKTGAAWAQRLCAKGRHVVLVADGQQASDALLEGSFDFIIMDMVLEQGSSVAVADLARYRQPEAQVIFVTNTGYFSDGALFRMLPNTRAYIRGEDSPDTLNTMIEFYAAEVATGPEALASTA